LLLVFKSNLFSQKLKLIGLFVIINRINTRPQQTILSLQGQKSSYTNSCDEDQKIKKKPKSTPDTSPDINKFLLYSTVDICLSALGYFITACGCLGWGQKLFPKFKPFLDKRGADLSASLNTVVGFGRVFLSPAINPLSLGLAATGPFINNRLYRWADQDRDKRYNFTNNIVYGIGIVAKASKRFTCPSEAITALLESTVTRLGRNITKDKLYSVMGTTPRTYQNYRDQIDLKV
jgi:hypothetical protein